MLKITIYATILDGNLGDGWRDNYETAQALGAFTADTWQDDLSAFEALYEIKIDIKIVPNTSGYSNPVAVHIDNDSLASSELCDITAEIENALTHEDIIWDMFCGSDIAAELSAEQ